MDEKRETIRVTHGIFQALLNLTGGDPELQQPRLRALVEVLHQGKFEARANRWALQVTEQDIESIEFVMQIHFLNRPLMRTRFTNVLCRQSPLYERLTEERHRPREAAA